jgi:hypothetical protein
MCSVLCPVGLAETASGRRWEPTYPSRDDGLRGLCARGNLLGELAGLPQRLGRAAVGCGPQRSWCPPQEAIRQLGEAIQGAERPALIVDGRLPWEDLAALATLAEAIPDATFCVYCPPHEAQLLAGIAFAKGTPARPEAMADCDAFLLVGDLFAVAPVAAGPVLVRKQQRAAIVSLDVGDTVTGRFAAHALQVAAGTEHVAVSALALAARGKRGSPFSKLLPTAEVDALAAACGVDEAALRAAAEAIGAAENPAVVIAPLPGRTPRWDLVGAAAVAAAGKGGLVVPATGYRAHAFLAAGALNAKPLAAALDGERDLLVVVGCNPAAATPGLWAKASGQATCIAAASALPNAVTDAARVLLPAPLAEESAGALLDFGGRSCPVAALLAPPPGAMPGRELAAAVGRYLGIESVGGRPVPETVELTAPDTLTPMETLPSIEPPDGKLLLSMRQDASAFADGSLTGLTSWSQATRPAPVIQLSADDAGRLGLADGDVAEVTSEHGRCRAAVALEPRQRSGQATINAAFAASRRLFDFAPVAAAVAVTVEKKES